MVMSWKHVHCPVTRLLQESESYVGAYWSYAVTLSTLITVPTSREMTGENSGKVNFTENYRLLNKSQPYNAYAARCYNKYKCRLKLSS